MGALIHRSDHPDLLVGALCDVIAHPLEDPFAPDVIAVPTRGIDRWLTQRIASTYAARGDGDGIAANIDFPFPSRIVNDVLSQIPGTAGSIEAWSRRSVIFHLQRIIDSAGGEDWMWLITRFVDGPDGDRSGAQRLRAAQRIERLFSSYAKYRSQMVGAWKAGNDVGPDGGVLPGRASWQPEMWRLLRHQIGEPAPFEVLPGALDLLRAGRAELDLPQRLSVYGVTVMDPVDLAVLEALGGTTEVHLFVLHPSDDVWRGIAPLVLASTGSERLPRRDEDPSTDLPVHPLLRSWGQESRELQFALGDVGSAEGDVRVTPAGGPETLLAALQSDIRANRKPSQTTGRGDRSIQIHTCHGPRRQVEVLRDAILHIMDDDETLEPRDIVIMTPDIETYAPLIEAAFPSSNREGDGLPDLRVRIADRSPMNGNPLARLARQVVELAASRLGGSVVSQLLAHPDVQRRFRIAPDQVGEIVDLTDDANVRWGLNGAHRDREGAGPRDEHTWRKGIDRILTGVFYDDDAVRVVADISPLGHVEGQVADAAGNLAFVIERVAAIVESLNVPAPASEWADRIATAVRLLAEPRWGDEWQWGSLDRLLTETFPRDSDGDPDPVLGIEEVAVILDPWGDDRPRRLHHRTGDVTVCTLVPMRSVPYRVVCLLGMENDRFPRSSRSDGDDLLVDDEVVVDRDRAAEDRQILLDALMVARDYFVLTYTGRDPLTNAKRPPAVPVAEMYETIEAMVGEDDAETVRTDHPLQSFSPRSFTDGELGIPGSWGYDPIQFAGAVALSERDIDDWAESGPSLYPVDEELPTLDRLIRYLKDPSGTFLSRSLGMFVPDMGDAPDDELPIGLDGLEQWSLADRLLVGIGEGHDDSDLLRHERASDTVPAGELADGNMEQALELAHRLDRVARGQGWAPEMMIPSAGAVVVDGEEITGSVLGDPDEALIADVSPSRAKPSRWSSLYSRVSFLSALKPECAWRGVLVGKKNKEGAVTVVTIGPFGEDPQQRRTEGLRRLSELVQLYREGMATPLPLFPETSFVWQAARPGKGRSPASSKWLGYKPRGIPAERDDPAIGILFPDLFEVDDLVDSDFPIYAERLWAPIQAAGSEGTVRPGEDSV